MAQSEREFRRLKKRLTKEGWTLRGKQKNHWKMACPCGEHLLVFPQSASDWRAIKNAESTLRHFGREGCTGIPADI